jgi:hypothetical protein
VPDARLEVLSKISGSKKIIPAIVEFVDIAGLVKGASEGQGLGNQFLSHIRETDAIAEVVRIYENADLIHVEGSVDPLRDIEIINMELILADMQTVEKRIQTIGRDVKRGDKDADGLKPRKKNAMRPALAQLTALRIRQQATLKAVGRIAAKTGVDISDIMGEAHGKLARLAAQSPKSPQARQAPASASARARARVQGGRPAPARQAPARMRRRADVENPAQPWPEPGSEGAFLPPENGASESLETPGLGTTIDTSADAVDDPTTIGLSLDDDGADATGDVTAPMEGTTEQRPDSETITEPEIQYRDLDPEGAFPVNFSESGSSPVESSLQRAQARVIAATRLANLRIAAGLASGDPIALMASISESAMTDRDIANETRTLMAVRQTAGAAPQARRLPVQAATRAVPSFSTQTASLAPTIGGNGLTDDDVLDIFGVDMSYTEPRTAARD